MATIWCWCEECEKVAKVLTEAGHDTLTTTDRPTTEEGHRATATGAVDAIKKAEAVVMLASPRRVPGGKFVEAGIAIGIGLPVYVLGHLENGILRHPMVERFDSAENLCKHLEG